MTQVTEKELIERSEAPRVTLEGLEANIAAEYAFNVKSVIEAYNQANPENQMPVHDGLGVLTLAVLVLNNGFTVVGESACADPANYKEDIGNRLAIANAKNKIWPLMGYALKEDLRKAGDETFLDRLHREAKELKDKLDKLEAFIGGNETFKRQSPTDRAILFSQRDAMREYYEILQTRLAGVITSKG